ncbi:MAG: hypothetical protein NTX50_05115 [Candidatus Sumerlaeota bacterium]|nr:hypothetical protein [Candidatus Sumerlaeota bacterium]
MKNIFSLNKALPFWKSFLTILCAALSSAGIWLAPVSSKAATGPESDASDVYWDDQFYLSCANGIVTAIARDTSGAIYLGGQFMTVAGNVIANGVAKWDPATSTWSALGTGVDGYISALAVDKSGNLYAGGQFSLAGDVPAFSIAKWDGASWSPLGSGIYGEVKAIAADGMGNVYAGGAFSTAGEKNALNIAKWNGVSWSTLGYLGMDGSVNALALDGLGNLYAGGAFVHANLSAVNHIAKWDGASWSALGTGTGGEVFALAADGAGNVYAGGNFTVAGETSANNIANWNGSSWSALGMGMRNESESSPAKVESLALDKAGNLYAGGNFTTAGATLASNIAKWNGSAWSALGTGINGYDVLALAEDGAGNLYAGGNFGAAGGAPTGNIAKWNGSSWSALAVQKGIGGYVYALAPDGAGAVYAGGDFLIAGGATANGIAKWDGASWSPLGSGMNSAVNSLAAMGPGALFAGGSFTTAGGAPANHIAKWDGVSWTGLGTGTNGGIGALAVDGKGNVYAGGSFTTAGGKNALNIAKWNGLSWSSLGYLGMDGSVNALALDGLGNLYAGGAFVHADLSVVNCIAKWNGATWSAMRTGMDATVAALAADKSGNVYAGGKFRSAGGTPANFIAKWNGASWSALGTGTSDEVEALALDSSGALYAGGNYQTADGKTVRYISKWDGSSWETMGTGMIQRVKALAVDRNALFAGGYFEIAGNKVSDYFACWQPRVNRSQALWESVSGEATLGDDIYGFYKPALMTSTGTLVSYAGGLPTTVTLDRAEEIQVGGKRVNGAFTLEPTGMEFGGAGATLRIEFSEDDVAANQVAPSDFIAVKLTYPADYPATKEAASVQRIAGGAPAPIRVENGRQIYAIVVPLAEIGSTYGAAPKSLVLLPAPTNPGAKNIATDSITWTWQDNSTSETGYKVWTDPGSNPPVTLQTTTGANVQEWRQSGLAPNTQYSMQAAAAGVSGDSDKTAVYTTWTLAATPLAPIISNPKNDSLDIKIGSGDGNPAATKYAIYCETAAKWAQANGALGASPVWQTALAWGTLTVTGLNKNAIYSFSVRARNGAGVETLNGPSTSEIAIFKFEISGVITEVATLAPVMVVAINPSGVMVAATTMSLDGKYALPVPDGFSGWVMAQSSRYVFHPFRRAFVSVQGEKQNQNFMAFEAVANMKDLKADYRPVLKANGQGANTFATSVTITTDGILVIANGGTTDTLSLVRSASSRNLRLIPKPIRGIRTQGGFSMLSVEGDVMALTTSKTIERLTATNAIVCDIVTSSAIGVVRMSSRRDVDSSVDMIVNISAADSMTSRASVAINGAKLETLTARKQDFTAITLSSKTGVWRGVKRVQLSGALGGVGAGPDVNVRAAGSITAKGAAIMPFAIVGEIKKLASSSLMLNRAPYMGEISVFWFHSTTNSVTISATGGKISGSGFYVADGRIAKFEATASRAYAGSGVIGDKPTTGSSPLSVSTSSGVEVMKTTGAIFAVSGVRLPKSSGIVGVKAHTSLYAVFYAGATMSGDIVNGLPVTTKLTPNHIGGLPRITMSSAATSDSIARVYGVVDDRKQTKVAPKTAPLLLIYNDGL